MNNMRPELDIGIGLCISSTTDDLEESIAQAWDRGMEVLFVADGPGTKVAYLRSPIRPGVIFEYTEGENMQQMDAQGIEQARQAAQ